MNTSSPTIDKLSPYLLRLDKSRVYANFGQLNTEYQNRLGGLFGAPVVTCSSATSGLIATLLALNLPKGSLVACPSYTFVATAASIVMAGHVPYFMDVSPETKTIVYNSTIKVAAIMVVSPCGAPLQVPKWDIFSMNTGIPVIIDAAGGFDAFSTKCKPCKSPVVISTHASKPFITSEGGFVTCHDKKLLEKIKRITNFGFDDARKVDAIGFNGKLSEYHAAVGLAEIDGWEDKRLRYLRKTKIYGLNYATSLVATKDGEGRKGVYGVHKLKAYADYPRVAMPVTEELIKKTSFVSVTL